MEALTVLSVIHKALAGVFLIVAIIFLIRFIIKLEKGEILKYWKL